MTLKIGLFRISLVVMMFLILAQTSWATNASRVQLRDGEFYENVTFEVDSRFKVIVIHVGDWTRNVSFPDVELILDEAGNDVTADYIGDVYSTQGTEDRQTWARETGSRDDSGQKYPFAVMLSAGGNFSVPIGDYYAGIESGIGFGGSIRIVATKELAVRLGLSKSGMKQEDLRGASYAPMIIVEDNTDFDAWRYYAAVEYYKWPHWREGGRTMLYFFSGLGMISHSFSGTFVACDPADECYLFGSDYSETKFMMTNGGGVVAMLGESIGVEIGAAFDLVFVSSGSSYGSSQYAMTLDLRVGLVTAF
jgi:hypothetical protein